MNWKTHKEKWIDCVACDLHECRTGRVILARGNVPCDVLFIGEAPGVSEDCLGKPFIGPSGKLLDDMITDAVEMLGPPNYELKIAFTNLVGCIPLDEGKKAGAPPVKTINACKPRLKEFVKLCNPSAIILVGKLSAKHVNFLPEEVIRETIIHPAAILRADISQKGLAIQRTIVQIRDVFYEV